MTKQMKDRRCRWWALGLSLAILVAAAAGCGRSSVPLAPVEGTVTLDGRPLAKGHITFEQAGTRPASGNIRDGKIVEVTSYTANDGAPIGVCRVAIQDDLEEAPALTGSTSSGVSAFSPMVAPEQKARVPTQYGDPKTSKLSIDVQPGMPPLLLELRS